MGAVAPRADAPSESLGREDGMSHETERKIPTRHDPDTERLTALLAETPSTPAPCEDVELSSVDFSKLDVLIGTVRSDAQFDYCMAAGVYYAPARTIAPEDLPVSVIALYEEGLHRKSGIKRYGEITETRVVPRSAIPVPMSRDNPDEAYYLFSVASWLYLDTPISIEDTSRGKPMFTNRFLFSRCRRSYQLVAIRSPEQYRLCELLCRLREEREVGGEVSPFRRVGERHLLAVAEGQLRLMDAAGRVLYVCPTSALTGNPAAVLRGVAEALGV